MADENNKIEELKKEINVLKGKITTFENKKNEIIKKRDETITKVVYEQRKEIEKTFDEILLEAEKRLKVAISDKEREKKKNLDTLIEKNTKEVRNDNLYLLNEIKKILKNNDMPSFVNSDFYFINWHPYTFSQKVFSLVGKIIYLLVATFVCFLMFKQNIWDMQKNVFMKVIVIAMVYLVFIAAYALIWLLVDKITDKGDNVFNEIIELRKNIDDNNKKIFAISKDTKTNIKDSDYDYTKLDREIDQGKLDVENRKKEKREALEKFSNEKEEEIKQKIIKEVENDIKAIENEIESAQNLLKEKQVAFDNMKIQLLNEKMESSN